VKFFQEHTSEILTAVVVLLICIGGFAAWNAWMRDTEPYVMNSEMEALRDSLDQSRSEKKALEKALEDSMALHNEQLEELLSDTNGNREITNQFNELRQEHRSLELDTAVGLLVYRMRIEPQYGTRFDYSLLSN
jgi:septal ring factor EnvC (AmiA/AmiB activator)